MNEFRVRVDRPRRALVTTLALAAMLGIGACSGGTGFQQTWFDPTLIGGLLDRVGVVGVAADPAVRTEFEDTFARTLKLRGNDARAGHTFIPEEMRGHLDQIKQKLFDEKFDGVLVTRLAPATSDSTGAGELEGNLQSPATGTSGATGKVQLRTSLYRVSEGKLMWDAVTASSRSSSIQKDAAFSETVARELRVQGMLR